MGKLSEAIREWVEAEFHFRNAYPNRLSTYLQGRLVEAEEKLREALTGHRGLDEAAKELGLPVDEIAEKWRKFYRKGGGFLIKEREESEPLTRVRIKEPKEREKASDSEYAKLARTIMYGDDAPRKPLKRKGPDGKKSGGLFD